MLVEAVSWLLNSNLSLQFKFKTFAGTYIVILKRKSGRRIVSCPLFRKKKYLDIFCSQMNTILMLMHSHVFQRFFVQIPSSKWNCIPIQRICTSSIKIACVSLENVHVTCLE